MVAFYNAKDQAIYDAGDKFVPQTEYLQNDYVPTKGISYEGDGSPVSYANSMGGIMSQAPIPEPLKYTHDGDGGGGDGPPGPGPDLGGITADDYGYGPVGDMGMTEEEQAGVDGIKNAKMGKLGIAKTLASFAFMGPFAGMFTAYRQNKKAKQDAIDKAKAAQQQRDFKSEIVGRKGQAYYDRAVATAAGRDPNQGNSVTGHGKSGLGRDPDDKMAKGGRVGYFFGGRVNYKAGGRVSFKNGGLASIL